MEKLLMDIKQLLFALKVISFKQRTFGMYKLLYLEIDFKESFIGIFISILF